MKKISPRQKVIIGIVLTQVCYLIPFFTFVPLEKAWFIGVIFQILMIFSILLLWHTLIRKDSSWWKSLDELDVLKYKYRIGIETLYSFNKECFKEALNKEVKEAIQKAERGKE